ncbi:MAG: hypothetical protein U1G07_18005 [Verrucomicrobiota bacterium]
MPNLRQLAVLSDDFELVSPAQHLLDSFLIGFRRRGAWERPQVPVTVWTAKKPSADLLERRRTDFGLTIADSLAAAAPSADAIMVVGAKGSVAAPEAILGPALKAARAGTRVFTFGLVAERRARAQEFLQLARDAQLWLASGTAIAGTVRLPDVELPNGTRVREGLVVVCGDFPAAELSGLEALLPLLERRQGGETGVHQLRYLEGPAVWEAGDKGEWSWPLLAAAISRSHTPQGHPVLDGRTEDLVGLGLVPQLARHPRGWLLEHADGLRSAILVLDGVVADINFAVRTAGQQVISAQVFRPPPPQEEEYSRLAGALFEFFRTGTAPWPGSRGLLETGVISAMASESGRSGAWTVLPS